MSRIYDTIIVSMIQYNLKPVGVRATRPGEPSGNKIFATNKTELRTNLGKGMK